jgi:hypothetical protein
MDVYIKWRLPVLLGWVHSSCERTVHVAMSIQTPPKLTLQFLQKLLAEAEPDVRISSFEVSSLDHICISFHMLISDRGVQCEYILQTS